MTPAADSSSRPAIRATALKLLSAAKGESIEAAITAACEIIYNHWHATAGAAGLANKSSPLSTPYNGLRNITSRTANEIARQVEYHLSAGSREDHYAIFNELLAIRTERLAKAGLSSSSAPLVATLMASLVGDGKHLADPACGTAGALVTAALSSRRQQVHGYEVNEPISQLAYQRLQLAGIHEAHVRTKDWFSEPEAKWDAIVAEPPFGVRYEHSPRYPNLGARDGDILWLKTIEDSLAIGGRAVVLSPAGTAYRGSAASVWRRDILTSGHLAAVIAMPTGSVVGSSINSVLYVLSTKVTYDTVLLINASYAMDSSDAGATLASRVVAACIPWLESSLPPREDPWFAQSVAIEDLISADDISPLRHLGPPPAIISPRPVSPGRLLTELRISRFKAIKDQMVVPLAPLTLIFGKNSAGKSSVLQALLLLKQSVESGGLSMAGPHVDLGTFTGTVNGHDSDQSLGIGITWNSSPDIDSVLLTPNPALMRTVDMTAGQNRDDVEASVQALSIGLGERRFSWLFKDQHISALSTPQAVDLVGLAYAGETFFPFSKPSSGQQESAVRRDLKRLNMDSIETEGRGLVPLELTRRFLTLLEGELTKRGVNRTYQNMTPTALRKGLGFSGAIADELDALLAKVVYIGPLRDAPSRVSRRLAANTFDLAFQLLNSISEQDRVSKNLQYLGMPYRLDVASVSERADMGMLGDIAAIVLTDTRSGVQLSPADVGFGVSQVLPIVVELAARSNSVILIEQPEIHLHPAMQADLADLLVESVDEAGAANQVIVETHSETLILRLLRRIREGTLDPSQVAVLYVDQATDGAANAQLLRIDSDGDFIDNWPNGFFSERLDEVFGDMF